MKAFAAALVAVITLSALRESACADGEITAKNAPIVATLADGRKIGVVDGDSLGVDRVEWRLMGFDTPEIDRAKCEAERRLAVLARLRLEQLVREAAASGRTIVLAGSSETDRHKRPLGDLMIGGRNVRETMIAEGYARPYNGGWRKGWCSRDSRDDLVPGLPPARERVRKP